MLQDVFIFSLVAFHDVSDEGASPHSCLFLKLITERGRSASLERV